MGCYRDALDAIFSHINFEHQTGHSYNAATFDLSRIEALLQRLGRPQERVRCIHIAGTKGKGFNRSYDRVDPAGGRLSDRALHVAASAHLPRADQGAR